MFPARFSRRGVPLSCSPSCIGGQPWTVRMSSVMDTPELIEYVETHELTIEPLQPHKARLGFWRTLEKTASYVPRSQDECHSPTPSAPPSLRLANSWGRRPCERSPRSPKRRLVWPGTASSWPSNVTAPHGARPQDVPPLTKSSKPCFPPALVITAEADVLRDEGEAYANQLRQAGVRTTAARFQGIIHDFVMLNALATTAAARGAIALATAWLRDGLATRLT